MNPRLRVAVCCPEAGCAPRRFAPVKPGILIFALTVLVIGTVSLARADCLQPRVGTCESGSPGAFFMLRTDDYVWCNLVLPPGEVTTVTVKVYSVPVQKIRFSLPDPPIGTVVDEWWGVSHTGDRATGIEVDLGECSTVGEVTIGQIVVSVAPDEVGPCTSWSFNEEVSEVQDCEGLWRPAENSEQFEVSTSLAGTCGLCGLSCCPNGLPPYDLYPPDGATDVPLDATLSWTLNNYYDDPPTSGCYIKISTERCGTDDMITVPCEAKFFAPDFLQAGTTYYWQPGAYMFPSGCNNGFAALAPIHSFTTEGPTAAESRTWGWVKALYRGQEPE